MKFPGIKKLFIYFSLALYLFLATGLNNFAFCFNDDPCHKMPKIECSCCHDSKMKHSEHSVNMRPESKMSNCRNCVKIPLPVNVFDQFLSKFQQPVAETESLCNVFPSLMVFRHTGYKEIHNKPNLVLNKNLDILRTVILLN